MNITIDFWECYIKLVFECLVSDLSIVCEGTTDRVKDYDI